MFGKTNQNQLKTTFLAALFFHSTQKCKQQIGDSSTTYSSMHNKFSEMMIMLYISSLYTWQSISIKGNVIIGGDGEEKPIPAAVNFAKV